VGDGTSDDNSASEMTSKVCCKKTEDGREKILRMIPAFVYVGLANGRRQLLMSKLVLPWIWRQQRLFGGTSLAV
jgi:hypothetical protein